MAFKDWSTTAGDNDDADASINWVEGQAPSTVNGSARSMMAVLKQALGHLRSVKDFGATGDGTTDDTTAIQAAIDSLENDGGVVFFPNGTYLISATLTVPSGVTLQGEGMRMWATLASESLRQRGSRIKCSTATRMVDVIGTSGALATQVERVGIKGLTLDGDSTATVGLRIYDFLYVSLEDVFVWKCTTGIQTGLTTNDDYGELLFLKNVHVANCTTGIDSSGSYEKVFVTFEHVHVRTATDAIKGPYTGAMTGGFIGGVTGIAFNIAGSQQFTVTGLQMENCKQAAYVDTAASGSLAIAEDVGFIGCSVTGNSNPMDKAFDVEQCRGFTAINNKIGFSGQGATMTGFDFGATAFDLTVLGNEFQSIGGSQTRYVHTSGARGLVNDRTSGWYFGAAIGNQWTFSPPSGVTRAFAIQDSTDTGPRLTPFTDGSLNWGDGAGTLDLKLARSAADTLRLSTGDSFIPQSTGQLLGGASNQWRVYHEVIATASLPAAGASMNGVIVIEDAGAGDRNLVIYGGGQRFRIDGGSNF